jgi:hypothetical protein
VVDGKRPSVRGPGDTAVADAAGADGVGGEAAGAAVLLAELHAASAATAEAAVITRRGFVFTNRQTRVHWARLAEDAGS